MGRKEQTDKIKKILNSVLFSVLALILIFIVSVPLAKNLSKKYKIDNEIKELENEKENLEGKNLELDNLVKYLESDQFVEEQARMNMNYKKQGESVVIIKKDEDTQENQNNKNIYSIPESNKMIKSKNKNIQKWIDYFFK